MVPEQKAQVENTERITITEWIKKQKRYVKDIGGGKSIHIIYAKCINRKQEETQYWYICRADGKYIQAYKTVYDDEELTIYIDTETAKIDFETADIKLEDIEKYGDDAVLTILHDYKNHRALVVLTTQDGMYTYYIEDTDGLFNDELTGKSTKYMSDELLQDLYESLMLGLIIVSLKYKLYNPLVKGLN